MKTDVALTLLTALAHEVRLALFRILVGGPGLSAGTLAARLGMSPSALSFHLKDLRIAGLIEARRDGRNIIYTAEADAIVGLMAFLAEDCCGGRPDLCDPWRPAGRTDGKEGVMDDERVYNVLFLCTGNSARSIMAECLIERAGGGKFKGFSAGSHPAGRVHPLARRVLERDGFETGQLRSKSWDEFAAAGAPELDFVFTVCDAAAGETCPVWPGQPMTAHWGVPDPVTREAEEGVSESELALSFAEAYRMLHNRISIFTSLPLASLDKLTLQAKLDEIGRAGGDQGRAHVQTM